MSIRLRAALIIAVQVIALLAMIGMKQWTLSTGTPIVLETAPIDPRSLFSGDYVRLSYAISNLRLDALAGDKDFKRHDEVYVVLQQDAPYARAVSVHHAMPPAGAGQVVIRGEVQYASDSLWNPQTSKAETAKSLSVHYGIENYYVPEGTGHALERPAANEKVSVRAAVDRYGTAGILAILVNGEARYAESLL